MGNFVLFILILFALAALLRIDFFFSILYLFAGVYIFSRLWSGRMLKRLQISRKLPQRAFWGDQITVSLKLENLSRLPIPWLLLSETFPVALASPPFIREVISLPGKASHTVEYTLHARQRGYYQIGPLSLQTGDLLGINRQLTSRFEADYLIVYPRLVSITRLGLPTHSPQVILATPIPLFPDPARMIGVRDYIPGDNPRHIHWPATAVAGQLLVKQFQPAIARENAIFLNLDRTDYARRGYPDPAIELAITVAASLARHMLNFEKLPVGLITTGFDPLIRAQQNFKLPPHKGRSQLIQILEILARVQAPEQTQFLARLRQEAVHLSWGTTVIVITSDESDELVETLLLLKKAGFQVTLVLIHPPTIRSYPQPDRPPEVGIPVFKIRREKDIEIWSAVL